MQVNFQIEFAAAIIKESLNCPGGTWSSINPRTNVILTRIEKLLSSKSVDNYSCTMVVVVDLTCVQCSDTDWSWSRMIKLRNNSYLLMNEENIHI